MLDGILNQLCAGFDIELLHYAVVVKFGGSGRNPQYRCDFLDGFSLRDELQNLSLMRAQVSL
jgi:hypothetical protein